MAEENRQADLNSIVSKALKDDPELARALDLYSMSQREYVRALASLRSYTILSSGDANLSGEENARRHKHDQRD